MPNFSKNSAVEVAIATRTEHGIPFVRPHVYIVLAIMTTPMLLSSCKAKPQGPFTENSIQEYISLLPADEETRQEDYIVGKIVAINTGDALSHHYETAFTRDDDFAIRPGTVSTVHDKLTPGLRATDPGQVGTVALLKWKKNVLRKNVVGIEFVQAICDVTLVDVAKRTIAERKTFAGSKPEGTHRWGSSPEKDIAKYINKLPRRMPVATEASELPAESSAPAGNP